MEMAREPHKMVIEGNTNHVRHHCPALLWQISMGTLESIFANCRRMRSKAQSGNILWM